MCILLQICPCHLFFQVNGKFMNCIIFIDDDFRASVLSHRGGTFNNGASTSSPASEAASRSVCTYSAKELHLILHEVRYITDYMRKQQDDQEVINDWKYAAMVVDRFCLIVFTFFTLVATIAVLYSAPHIIVEWLRHCVHLLDVETTVMFLLLYYSYSFRTMFNCFKVKHSRFLCNTLKKMAKSLIKKYVKIKNNNIQRIYRVLKRSRGETKSFWIK